MADVIAKQLSHLSLMNDKLRALLECPVCLDTCSTPIFFCFERHPVCARCKPRLTKCPVCRGQLDLKTRCRFMEKISALVKVPCENKVEGCQEVLDREEKTDFPANMADAIAKQLSDLSLLNDKMRALLECPVCLDTCSTTIFVCRAYGGDHPVCARCQPSLTQCPTCRMPGQPKASCWFMEKISALVKVPCENKMEGCLEVLDKEELVKHWETCGKQPRYKCVICDKSVCNRNVLVEHVQKMHQRDYVKGSGDVSFNVTPVVKRRKPGNCVWKSHKLIFAHDNHFFVGVLAITEDGTAEYKFYAGCVGSPADKELNNFKCKFTYFSTDGSVQQDTWISVTLLGSNLFSNVLLNEKFMEQFFSKGISKGGRFVCTAEIFKQ